MNDTKPRKPRRIGLKLLMAGVALLVADQVVQHMVIGEPGWIGQRRIAPFDPPIFHESQESTLKSLAIHGTSSPLGDVVFDAELGWTGPAAGSSELVDWCGGRAGGPEVPREKSAGVTRVAVFGCSFSYGSEVEGKDAWPAQLDRARDDLEVLNFGVPGYGVDQAMLRYERVGARTDADEVWLGLLPATVLRLVSVYRPALRHYTNTVALKPRFRFEGDTLQLVPHPAKSVDDLVNVIRTSQRFQVVRDTDGFMTRAPAAYAESGSHIAHHFATTRILLTLMERGGREWETRIQDESDECRRLAQTLILRMRDRVVADGRTFRLVILPDHGSLTKPAPVPWNGLVTTLRSAGIEVVDTTPALHDANAADRGDMWAHSGHYSPQANQVVADALAAATKPR